MNLFNQMRDVFEDIVYKGVILNLLMLSQLGRQSVLGEAATGYNFDHMYENRPSGRLLVGKLVDRFLLNLPAVRATRARRENIVKILNNEIDNHRIEGRTSRIIDIACGVGRYLTDALDSQGREGIEIVGIDFDKKSITMGKALAVKHGIPRTRMRLVRGNVFKLMLLKKLGRKIQWRPNIIIASGLTVYIDDEKTKEMIKQAHEALEKTGLFLFDSQENNPSRKLMEKVGRTKTGAWALFYRKPSVWRKWLYEAGFKDIRISRDQWGMYNLCTARRI